MPFTPGFDSAEAQTLIAIIAKMQGPTPPLVLPPIPSNWQQLYDSPEMGHYKNKWQLWRNSNQGNQFAVVIRGTVEKPTSIMEDLLSVMIPARGTLPLGRVHYSYQFATDPQAAVHLGFVLGALIVLLDKKDGIVQKLSQLVPQGSEIFIAGHSQGAAIATLCRSFLYYATVGGARTFKYKAYVFAQPKPGNDHYACDFEEVVRDMGFRVTNTQDWVPQVPLTYETLGTINDPNPLDLLPGRTIWHRLVEYLIEKFRKNLMKIHLAKLRPQVETLGEALSGQTLPGITAPTVSRELVVLPTLNFCGCGWEIVLAGNPGTNPSDAKDFMWQHHAAMYSKLLRQTSP